MPHHAPSGSQFPPGRVAPSGGTTPHRSAVEVLSLKPASQPNQPASQPVSPSARQTRPARPASQPAQAVFYPDNTKQCIISLALSITCRNQSAPTAPGPLLITALYVLRRTNFYREGIPYRCTQQRAGHAPNSTTPPPFQLTIIPKGQFKASPAWSCLHPLHSTDVTPRSSLRLAESLSQDPAHGQSMQSNSTGSH